jgi:hypothetical protein
VVPGEELFLEFEIVGYITVVSHTDTEGRVDIKGLSILFYPVPYRWISDVANADVSFETGYVLLVENIPYQPVPLFDVKSLIERGDTSSVLTAVLDRDHPLINHCDGFPLPDYSYDSTHVFTCYVRSAVSAKPPTVGDY